MIVDNLEDANKSSEIQAKKLKLDLSMLKSTINDDKCLTLPATYRSTIAHSDKDIKSYREKFEHTDEELK